MATMKSRLLQIGLLIALIVLLAVPRLSSIDRFATIDEPYWLTAGSNFYYALGQRAFANTIYDYHPAVTTMWIVTLSMLVYFPQYRGLGQGYFDVYKDSLERFLLAHDRTPLGLLTTARVIQTFVIVILLLVAFMYLRKLLGGRIAVVGILLVSFDPFFLGHSRLLNHEGMLALLVLISVLSLHAYLFFDRKLIFLLLSGAAAGFAQLTKSSSFVLLPLVVLVFFIAIFTRNEISLKKRLAGFAADLAVWLAVLGIIYFVFWPGMWVAPGAMLYQVFGNALSYAFRGSRLSVTGAVQSAQFQPNFDDIASYFKSVLWRTTPVVWVGDLLGMVAMVRMKWRERLVLLSVFLIGILFILLFGIANGRNSAHYVMTAYVSMDIIAAVGFTGFAGWVAQHIHGSLTTLLPTIILCSTIALQAIAAFAFFPYYYNYYNPIMEAWQPGRQNPNFGYGEGLDLAANYLAQKPDAADSTVTAFYGFGPFSFFYPGKTEQLKPVYADAENVPQLIQVLHASRYLVIYYKLQEDRQSPANVMRALEAITPEKSIWLNDIEYIRIFRVDSLPPNFYVELQP